MASVDEYEYASHTCGDSTIIGDLLIELNDLGKAGWQVCHVFENTDLKKPVFILMRPKPLCID